MVEEGRSTEEEEEEEEEREDGKVENRATISEGRFKFLWIFLLGVLLPCFFVCCLLHLHCIHILLMLMLMLML